MNPNKTIDYPHNQPNNEDIFDKLIKKIIQLRLIIDKHKQAWKYLLSAGLMLLFAIIVYCSTNYGI